MAIGVAPVFISPRVDLPPEEEGRAYFVAKDNGVALSTLTYLMTRDLESLAAGRRAQAIVKERFSLEAFSSILRQFMEVICR